MANIITNSEVNEIADPKLRKVLLRVAREMELSIEKVAANHSKSNDFPLSPDPASTERILATRFNSLPKEIKDRAGSKALVRINAPAAARQRRFGDLAAVNIKAATAIEAQVKDLPLPADMKFSQDHLAALIPSPGHDIPSGVTPLQPMTKLEFRIHKVKCVDETGGWYEFAGNDEIDLGGTIVDESGDVHKIPKFRVGSNFDDGEQVVFLPPRSFTVFNLTEGTAYPKSYFVTMVLAEVDMGGLNDFLDNLLRKVRDKVISALIAAFGGLGASGGPVGAIIGMGVGFVVGKVFDWLKGVWSDDIFKPVTVSVNITSLYAQWAGGRTDSPEYIATFSGHDGKYEVTYDWRMFA